nr:HEAT repeat-containing protein 6-like [Lytechinus pictus]
MDRNYTSEERQKFKACVSKLRNLVPSKNEDSRKTLNALLDELNSLDYSIYGLIDEDAGQILCQACRLVPLQDNLMVTKVCQLIVIITHQKVNLTKPSTTALLEFVIGVSKQCVSWMLPDTLRALGAILYENGPKSEMFLEEMLMPTPPGLLQKMVLSHDHEVRRTAILCVANACMKSEDGRVISEPLLSLSLDIILSALHTSKPTGCDDYTHVRFLLGALRGLQNLLSAQKNIHVEQLGSVLAALKSYSLYGLPGIGTNFQIPSTLFPSSLYQSSPSPARPNTQPKGDDVSEGKGAQGGTPKSSTGRKNKRRGGKKQQEKELAKQQREKQEENPTAFMKQGGHQPDGTAAADGSSNQDALSFWPSWGRVSSSESEYSDSEGGQVSKLRSASCKVRQASLGCLHSVVKHLNDLYVCCTSGSCNTKETDIAWTGSFGWSSWGDWSECHPSCGPGSRSRSRICDSPAERCLGESQEDEECQQAECVEKKVIGCGIKQHIHFRDDGLALAERVVGGQPADSGDWPWQAQLFYQTRGGWQPVCGGTLIDPQVVLTAAHCFMGSMMAPSRWQVHLGKHSIDFVPETGSQHRLVREIIVHKKFNQNGGVGGDIALLLLDEPVHQETGQINWACLDEGMKLNAKTECYISGWGFTEMGGKSPQVLHEAKMPLIPRRICNYKKSYNGKIERTMLCAGHMEGGIDACQGDSGGPLSCLGSDDHWYVVGVTSWGHGCAIANKPGVYTRVSSYLDWIHEMLHHHLHH